MDRHHFDFEIYKCLAYGDETKLAKAAGTSAGYYSQMLNPEDPRESNFYRAAQDFVNWHEANNEGAAKAFTIFCSYVERHICETDDLNVQTETSKALKEVGDIVDAVLNGKPLYSQLIEILEAERQLRKDKQAVLSAIEAEKNSFNGSRTRINGTRQIGKAVVAAHRRSK